MAQSKAKAKAYDPRLRLVDVRAQAIELLGAEAVAEIALIGDADRVRDWRFEIDTPTGGETTFNRHATADHVAASVETLKREAAALA